MSRTMRDGVPDTRNRGTRTFQPLEECAVIKQEDAAHAFGFISPLRSLKKLVQVQIGRLRCTMLR